MSAAKSLVDSLSSINANALISGFGGDPSVVEPVASSCEKIALWANALTQADSGNVALPFLAEMQRASHDIAALLALSLYVPAAAAMRSMAETALYYSYFRQHPAELTTLVRDSEYYISKKEILEFHKQHTLTYIKAAAKFGIPGDLNRWYSELSAIVHGQVPGAWGTRVALAETKHVPAVLLAAVDKYREGVQIIDSFLFLTVGSELWGRFHSGAKRILLKGIPADRRLILALDGK